MKPLTKICIGIVLLLSGCYYVEKPYDNITYPDRYFEADPYEPDSLDTPTPITDAFLYEDDFFFRNIHEQGDSDYFLFDTQRVVYAIHFRLINYSAYLNLELTLWIKDSPESSWEKEHSKLLEEDIFQFSPNQYIHQAVLEVSSPHFTEAGAYTLQLERYILMELEADAYESDNSESEATRFEEDIKQEHTIHDRSDVDYYQLLVDNTTRGYSFSFQFEQENGLVELPYDVWLAKNEAATSWTRLNTNNLILFFRITGYYYFKILAPPGRYSIELNLVPIPAEPDIYETNNDRTTSFDIPPNTTFTGTIHNNADQDYFRFETAKENQLVHLLFLQTHNYAETYPESKLIYRLLSNDGTVIYPELNAFQPSYQKSITLSTPGSYYLAISSTCECTTYSLQYNSLCQIWCTTVDWYTGVFKYIVSVQFD